MIILQLLLIELILVIHYLDIEAFGCSKLNYNAYVLTYTHIEF